MKLGTFISSPTRKNIFVPSDSNHMMMSSMRCKHGCVVRIPPSIERVLRNGFPTQTNASTEKVTMWKTSEVKGVISE
jgi:hypothetical protein